MGLFFAIYLLGSLISLTITLITLKINKNKGEDIINYANDKISERFNYYDRVDLTNANFFCVVNFLMSWAQVAMFVYAYLPSFFIIKVYFFRFIYTICIWVYNKSGRMAQIASDKHNSLIQNYNKKHGIN
jgi:hypothetical protein